MKKKGVWKGKHTLLSHDSHVHYCSLWWFWKRLVLGLECSESFATGMFVEANKWNKYLEMSDDIFFFLWWLSTIVDCSGQFLAAILSIFVPPPSCILNHCSPLIHMIFVQEQQGMNVSYHTKTWIEFGCPMVSTKNHVLWKKHMSIVDLQVWNFDGEPTWLQKAA